MLTVRNEEGTDKARVEWVAEGVEISIGIGARQWTTFTREQAQELIDKILTILKSGEAK